MSIKRKKNTHVPDNQAKQLQHQQLLPKLCMARSTLISLLEISPTSDYNYSRRQAELFLLNFNHSRDKLNYNIYLQA